MRILITTFTFAPQANGVAIVVGALASGLARRGHEVIVATSRDAARAPQAAGANPRVVDFGIILDDWPPDEVRRYQTFVQSFDGDIILCHGWQNWATDFAVAVFASSPARKVLLSHGYVAHRWVPYKKFAWGLGQWLKFQPYLWRTPRLLRAFDHVVFLSARVDFNRFFDHWLLRRLRTTECSVIPNGTFCEDPGPAAPDFRRQHGLGGKVMLLYVSAYLEGKNQEMAVRAFRRAGLADAVLVFIGNELTAYARKVMALKSRLAQTQPVGRVVFLEKLDRDAIQAAYRAADLFVLTSKGETQPLVILDAMARGKPFLATDVGCVADLPGGLVVRTEAQLSRAMRELCLDATRREALGRVGLEACRTSYNWPSVVDACERLFQRLVRK